MKVTMATIAKQVGVSKNAVSLALRNDPSVSEETRKRILEVAEQLGYQRNPAHGELMSQMRRKGHGSPLATLALINANAKEDAFCSHPTIPDYVRGAQDRAADLGYPLDTFWIHQPRMRSDRWIQVLETRGVRGLILTGMMKQNRLPEHFLPVIEAFPTIVTGVRTREPALSFACVDHHILTLRAVEQALRMGYRRPGLVLDPVIDQLVEQRFSAGFRSAQELVPISRRLAPFFQIEEARKDPACFHKWLEKKKPDVLFTLYTEVKEWLQSAGVRIPEEMGLIQLEWRSHEPEWAGMNQHNDQTGQAAVDMLIGMIHHGTPSIQDFPRATLIGPSWVDGQTVRQQKG